MKPEEKEIKKTVNLINGLNGELPAYSEYELEFSPVH